MQLYSETIAFQLITHPTMHKHCMNSQSLYFSGIFTILPDLVR